MSLSSYTVHALRQEIRNRVPVIPKHHAMAIMVEMCAGFRIRFNDLKGPSRKRELADIRCICYHEITDRTGLGPVEIGSLFSRDHSAVTHGINRYQELIKVNKGFKQKTVKATEILQFL